MFGMFGNYEGFLDRIPLITIFHFRFGDVGGKALIVSILSIFNALGRAGAGAVFAKYRPLMCNL